MIARHRGEEIKLIQPTNIDTVFFERDKRYRTLIRELKSFDNPYVLFIESNEKVLNALRLIKEKRLSKRYERVILYMSEIYWDECNTNEPINDLLDDNVIDVNFSRLKNNPDARQIKISGIKFDV